jgi:hypothetical protein
MRYALQTSKGKFVVELPPECSEKDLENMKSFMNWAYRQAGGKPPKQTWQHRLFGTMTRESIDGSHYSL